jgi:transcriptional accessory protein Tex/SPT6
VNAIDFGNFEKEVGKYTLTDIRDEMLKPARDPRKTFKAP